MKDRAATYDKPQGERSMGATVEAFKAVTGHHLTEEQGWLFMSLLKAVRSQQGGYRADSYEDGAAYFALAGEAAARDRKKPIIRELYTEADEKRMDIIGPNGNDGIHYDTLVLPEDVIIPESAHFVVVYKNGQMVAHDLKPALVQGCWHAAAGNQYIGLGDGSQAGLYERMSGDIWVRVAD